MTEEAIGASSGAGSLNPVELAMRRALALLSMILFAPAVVQAQMRPSAPKPAGWRWCTDGAAADSSFEFQQMAPGWHMTQGPGAILNEPSLAGSGRFVLETEMILFPDAKDGEYGVFAGGVDGGAGCGSARWTAFVVRGDGKAAVLRREGGTARELMPWTAHEAVKPRAAGATVKNVLTVRAEPDSVRFLVNGVRVGSWGRSELEVDGMLGFRMGAGVNLHITNLDLTKRMAPYPAPKGK